MSFHQVKETAIKRILDSFFRGSESRKRDGSTAVSQRKTFYVYVNFDEGSANFIDILAKARFLCMQMRWFGMGKSDRKHRKLHFDFVLWGKLYEKKWVLAEDLIFSGLCRGSPEVTSISMAPYTEPFETKSIPRIFWSEVGGWLVFYCWSLRSKRYQLQTLSAANREPSLEQMSHRQFNSTRLLPLPVALVYIFESRQYLKFFQFSKWCTLHHFRL